MENKSLKHWMVLAVTCCLSIASMGVMQTSGIFFIPVASTLQINVGTFAIHVSILMFTGSIASVFVPKMLARFSFKKILLISALVVAVSTALMSVAKDIPTFFVLSAIRGTSSVFFSMIPISMIVNQWFAKKHGLATGIVFALSAVGTAVLSPVFASLINGYGWQNTYLVMGVIVFVLCLPAIIYPFSMNPQEDGLLAYGADDFVVEDNLQDEQENNLESGTVNKKYSFPIFIALTIYVSLIATLTTLSQQIPTFAQSINLDLQIGAMLVSAIMIGNVFSKLLIGVISDMFGEVKAVLMMVIINVLGIVIFLSTTNLAMLYIAAFLFGAIFSVGSVGGILLFKKTFGVELFPKLYPMASLVIGVAAAMAVPMIGFIYDYTKTFSTIFVIGLVIHLIAFLSLIFVIIKKNKFL